MLELLKLQRTNFVFYLIRGTNFYKLFSLACVSYKIASKKVLSFHRLCKNKSNAIEYLQLLRPLEAEELDLAARNDQITIEEYYQRVLSRNLVI